ncbi:hypothetical protein SCA03_14520 [Streptomyces cacaoi]|uniref:HTH cro/C1-type domain-containing protein n=1 Tax=Streptomyces cacaoi TaxID=1898 RepID=A0A4Y3QUH7_STRCI|nr:hypothetical protein SCA03_14520 [Streptomyces cacaoi]
MGHAEEFVERVREALQDRRMSIRSASRALSYDHAYLSRVLAGKQEPSPELTDRLRRLLRLGEDDLPAGRAPAPPASVADFLPAGDPLAPLDVRTGRRIGTNAVSALSQRVHALRLADDVVYGHDLIGPALRELRGAVRLYRESTHTEDVGRELLRVIGELGQIAGWVASDAGRYDEAERIYRLGLSAAHTAGDATLASQLLGSLAYQLSNTGQESAAREMALAALDGAPGAPPRARALNFDRVAWAYAMTGQAQSAMRAVGDAGEALAGHGGESEPSWLYWVDAGELEVMEARVHTELHRPLRAVPLLRRVLDQYDTTHTRELALYSSWLAMALADANEPEEAAATTQRVITLSSAGSSERAALRSSALLHRLEKFRDVPEVAALLAEHRVA